MKIRSSFVSNSSSSSFVIDKTGLTEEQIWAIKNHIKVACWLNRAREDVWLEEKDCECEDVSKCSHKSYNLTFYKAPSDEWIITETDTKLLGDTYMDSFDIEKFLDLIGVSRHNITVEKDG